MIDKLFILGGVAAGQVRRKRVAQELQGEATPKVSKITASSHLVFPGYVDEYEQEVGDWTVSIESCLTDMDYAPFFKGAPKDQCQAHHVGYVLKGKFGVRRGDGVEEIFDAVADRGISPVLIIEIPQLTGGGSGWCEG